MVESNREKCHESRQRNHVHAVSLRERRDDIVPLAERFLQRFAQKYHRPLTGLSPEAAELLKARRWNGNIRELQNCIEKAVILSEGRELTGKDLQLDAASGAKAAESAPAQPDRNEEALVREAMERTAGNISAAAKLLGVSRPTLYAKLKKYGL